MAIIINKDDAIEMPKIEKGMQNQNLKTGCNRCESNSKAKAVKKRIELRNAEFYNTKNERIVGITEEQEVILKVTGKDKPIEGGNLNAAEKYLIFLYPDDKWYPIMFYLGSDEVSEGNALECSANEIVNGLTLKAKFKTNNHGKSGKS